MNVLTKLYLLYMIFYLALQTSFFCKLLKPRTFLRHPFVQCYVLLVLFMLPAILLKDTHKTLSTCYTNICIVFFSLAFFDNPISKRLDCYAAWFITCVIGESLAGFSYTAIYRLTGVELLPINLTGSDNPLQIAASLILDLFFIFLMYKSAVILFASRFNYIGTLLLLELSIPVITSQMVLSILYASRSKTQYIILAAAMILVYIIALSPLQKGLKQLKKQEQIRLNNEAYKLYAKEEAARFKNLEKEFKDLRKWNHDISNHLLSLSYLFNQKRYEEAKKYADTLLQKTQEK